MIEGDAATCWCACNTRKRSSGWGDNDKTEPTDLRLGRAALRRAGDRIGLGRCRRRRHRRRVRWRSTASAATSSSPARRARPSIESVSGDLRVTVNSPDVHVETVSGDLTLRGKLDGEMRMPKPSRATSTSTATACAAPHRRPPRCRAMPTSASASPTAAASSPNRSAARCNLCLPKSLSARVTGETFSGDLNAPGAEIDKPSTARARASSTATAAAAATSASRASPATSNLILE